MNGDRGAVGVFVAISIVVLFAFVGLTIDVGALYEERRELQNGADAAALAVAEDCALELATCNPADALSTAGDFASGNADDGVAAIAGLDLDTAGRVVTVHTSTLNTDGTTVVDPYFAEVVGFDGATVHAEATAIWGYPRSLFSLPLIISECELPTEFPAPPTVLYFHDGNNAEPCNAQAGLDTDGDGFLAGGFGWLAGDGDCDLFLEIGNWDPADPGSSPTTGCDPVILQEAMSQPIPLPFFDDLFGVGQGGNYHIGGFGLFQITGYNFGGQFKVNPPCQGDERCVSGFFASGVVYDGEPGGPDTGIRIVKLVG